MTARTTGLAQSVHTRLVRHAHELGFNPNQILLRYATERFLYRLSLTPHADRFVLKGALLMVAWLGEEIRPTQDADLLGRGDFSDEALRSVFLDAFDLKVTPDAVEFERDSLAIQMIRAEDPYGGRRATFNARIGATRLRVQVDIGIGDSVEPAPELLEYPSLLDLPRPRLRAYRPETSIAEKLHAMVVLGAGNSRMRDFFDVHALAMRERFEGGGLSRAVTATFARRSTSIPPNVPLALTDEFARIGGKDAQWKAFIDKNAIHSAPASLAETLPTIRAFLVPVLESARNDSRFESNWPPGGPWS